MNINICAKECDKEVSKTVIRYERLKQVENSLTAAEWEECLRFFEYRDAYTGLPLQRATQDHIVPITSFGGTVKNNIVPCERSTNSSKHNNNMIVWYKQQIFFDENRLNKILEWMGEYKKYLYVPPEQYEFISTDSKSVQYFKITLPNGRKAKLYYSSNITKARMTLLLKKTLDKWEDYLNEHWLWLGKFDPYRLNYEDKVKSMLDRCASFLLFKKRQEKGVLNLKKYTEINKNEVPLSCCGENVQDIVYGITSKNNYNIHTTNKNMIVANEVLLNKEEIEQKNKIHKKRLPKIKKRRMNSQQYKIKKIYTTDDKKVLSLYKLKNKDLSEKPVFQIEAEKAMQEENMSFEELKQQYPARKYKMLSENELLKWQNKPFKNIFGENIYEYRTKVVKGNKGLIDPKQPYKWAWCYVNTCNEFEFNNKKYQIDKSVKQYQGRLENTRRKDKEVVYDMDMILCYGQGGKQYYFDQNIDRINSKHIVQI